MAVHPFFQTEGFVPEAGNAPQTVIDGERGAYTYHAIVERRGIWPAMSAEDFRMLGSRFVSLVDHVYQGTNLELNVGASIPLGNAAIAADFDLLGLHQGDPGGTVALDSLHATPGLFDQLFEVSETMSLKATPDGSNPEFGSPSFASMHWTRHLPNVIRFYAQDGFSQTRERDDRPLLGFLVRRMFFGPDTPQPGRYRPTLGSGAVLRATMGLPKPLRRFFVW